MRFFEYRHVVTFEETNLIGNVYFVNHLRWQGHCRELFLREHAPAILESLSKGLALVTVHCSCEYYSELFSFDEISIRMGLDDIRQNRVHMNFEYWRINGGTPTLVARGSQHIACMQNQGGRYTATNVPGGLLEALIPFSSKTSMQVVNEGIT
jgi:enediyne biosynthesis thioesterase